jgi:16S rRNA (cytosine967-C5)-methyltransferase
VSSRALRKGAGAGLSPRGVAARVLTEVCIEGRSLATALPGALEDMAPTGEGALVQEMCYGVLRFLPSLEAVAHFLLHKPLKRRDCDIYCLILVGLYQLQHMRVASHAAVAETVDAAEALGKDWAKQLVNAVLRRFLRERDDIEAQTVRDDEARYNHPAWLLDAFRSNWPKEWRDIVAANVARAPMTVRVNLRRSSRDAYRARLASSGPAAHDSPHSVAGLVLESPCAVGDLPGFADGEVSVQDGGAQLAAPLLDLGPGQRVLDACAAPGGKAAQIIETQPDLDMLVAVEIDEHRLASVHDAFVRLGLRAQLIHGDASVPSDWWDGVQFDRILLDAPCSGTGVIRRHPDIKRLRRATDIAPLVERQERLLEALWSLLRPDGLLLYVTCSILPVENRLQVETFLARHGDAREHPFLVSWGRDAGVGRQILPGEDEMDGFYYARLKKLRT